MADYEIVLKKVEPQKVAAVRGIVPEPGKQGMLWAAVMGYLKMHGVEVTGPCITLYHDDAPSASNWDVEAVAPITADLPSEGRVRVYELPGAETMATTVHEGPWATVGEAYTALSRWIQGNGYEIAGQAREVILRMAEPQPDGNVSQTDPGGIVEIQFPVRKA